MMRRKEKKSVWERGEGNTERVEDMPNLEHSLIADVLAWVETEYEHIVHAEMGPHPHIQSPMCV